MIHNIYKTSLLFLVLLTFCYPVKAQLITKKEPLVTKIMDWKDPYNDSQNNIYRKSAECGVITFQVPKWVNIYANTLLFKKGFTHNDSAQLLFFNKCKTKDITLSDEYIRFNKDTKEWELSDEAKKEEVLYTHHKAYTIYQLKGQNGVTGWLTTHMVLLPPSFGMAVTKTANFCLFNKSYTKQFCGQPNQVQFISDEKYINSRKNDYTPTLIQILETLKFENDK